MSNSQIHTAIHAPPPLVWRILLDADGYPEWNPYIVGIDGALVSGGLVRLRLQNREFHRIELAVVVDIDPARFALSLSSSLLTRGLFDCELSCRIDNRAQDDPCLTLYQRSGGLLGKLLTRFIDDDCSEGLQHMGRALKTYAEKRYLEGERT